MPPTVLLLQLQLLPLLLLLLYIVIIECQAEIKENGEAYNRHTGMPSFLHITLELKLWMCT